MKSAYYIISFSMVSCDIFSKDTKCVNHITDWSDFRCCFVFALKNELRGGHFGVLTGRRNLPVSSCTGTLITKDKVRFAFCRTQ